MDPRTTEIQIRAQTKQVLKHLEERQLERAQEIILKNKEILGYNLGLINFDSLIPRIRFSAVIPRNYDALKMIIDAGCQIFSEEDNVDELLFFSAAKCDTDKLKYCVRKIMENNPNNINQTREGDTVLMFLIKYGNLIQVSFPVCLKILIDAGIDVNRSDYLSQKPILFLAKLYSKFISKARKEHIVLINLKKSIEFLLDSKRIDLNDVRQDQKSARDILQELHFEGLDYDVERQAEESEVDKLFKFLILGDQDSFKKSVHVKNLIDIDDGNNTLLQLCCQKNLKEAAQFLIDNGANLSKTTGRNPKYPIEIAARRNHAEIFEALLKTNKIVVDEHLFLIFLRNRPRHIKAKYFDEILKYKHLNVNIKSNNGNTPLHYAVIFSSREAIMRLLQRGASLTVKNHSMKCPLDYMNAEDLEPYLDKCILRDSYNHVDSGKYEAALNFKCLLENDESNIQSELSVLEKISTLPKLCHLLNHTLLSSFIDMKWKLVERFYQKVFAFQLIFSVISILSYINLNLLNSVGVGLVGLYVARITLLFNWHHKPLHEMVDITIAAILMVSVYISNSATRYQLGIMAAIFMALSLHLIWSFSPKFAEFHAALINITSYLLSYASYVLMLTLFFGAASYIFTLIQYDSFMNLHHDPKVDIFIFSNMQMLKSHFYVLCALSVFIAVMIVMTVINCIVFVREHISDDITHNFKKFGQRNILTFLKCTENLHRKWGILRNQFVFDEIVPLREPCDTEKNGNNSKKTGKGKSKNRYFVNFFVNVNKFSVEKLLSVKLSELNVSKIRKAIMK